MSEKKKAYIFDVYDDYALRLKYIRNVLEEKGYETTVYLSDFDHFHKEPYKKRYDVAEYIHALPYKKNFSFARIHSHIQFSKDCLKVQQENPADLVYAMTPPNSTAYYFGKHRKKNPDYKLIFDVCDMWPEAFPVKGMKGVLAAPFGVWAHLRNAYLKYADLVMTECDLFRDILLKYVPADRMKTFWMCRPQAVSEVTPVENDILTFVYLGSINYVVDVESIAAFADAVNRRQKIRMHIIGDGESRPLFLSLLNQYQIDYEYHGLVFDENEKRRIFSECHYGFNMMKNTSCIGLTMKSLDYLSYDLPIINNVPADTWKFVDEEKLGINVDDIEKAAEKILTVTDEEYTQMQKQVITFFHDHLRDEVFEENLAALL